MGSSAAPGSSVAAGHLRFRWSIVVEKRIPTAIAGVTGYEGINAARLLADHPRFRLVAALARTGFGTPLGAALPSLAGTAVADLPITESPGDAELIIMAVPHGPAAELAARWQREGRKIVDCSADFRLHDTALYARWYGHPHPAPDLLPRAVYGLCEWRRDEIRASSLIANPGCFPTAALLALLPAFAADLVEPDAIVDAKTGVSGAGRSPSRRVHFAETSDSVAPYGVAGHRHLPEMEGELAAFTRGKAAPRITFIPHLLPMNRGLLATCYATLHPGVTAQAVHAAYHERYAGDPFITILEQPPETGWVRGSNRCLLSIHVDSDRRRLTVISAIDNLMKGGAGQAVQNANLLFDLPEMTGLTQAGVWP